MNEIKRICVYGTGGVGGYFGGRIAEAIAGDTGSGREVYFIARGKHLEAIRQNGIVVHTPDRTIRTRPAGAADDFSTIPYPDLILLCVKSYDLPAAINTVKRGVKRDTVIIPLLNGIDIYERIRGAIVTGFVLPACIYLGTHIETPGVIRQNGGNGIILSGKDPGDPSYEAGEVKRFFQETGIGFEFQESAYPAIWEKYIFIAAFGLVTAASEKTLGEVMDDPELRQTAHDIMNEIKLIADKKEIGLADDIVAKTLEKAYTFPYETKTSYQRDVEAWPKPNEGDLFGGVIINEGGNRGVPTPVTRAVYDRILSSHR